MSFTGKATYSAGATLPEIAEDVGDIVGVVSPHETALLDALGDPLRPCYSTVHEWLEDALLGNQVAVQAVNPAGTTVTLVDPGPTRVGDQLLTAAGERILVNSINAADAQLVVTRAYGGGEATPIEPGSVLTILGNAALEGDDASAPRFTNRVRKANYTQIFTSTVEISGSELAVRQLAVGDEMDWQKSMRLKELLRDLENTVINGNPAPQNPQGTAAVRRTMRGIRSFIATNIFRPDVGEFPDDTTLTEEQLNLALRTIWRRSSGNVDLVVVNGQEKRAINNFIAANRRYYNSTETFKDHVSVYESDFGVCRVVLSRHVPPGTVLLLDSSRISVMPLAGRSFHFKPLARTGDSESGQLLGEYTLELRNESAHGIITGLAA